MASAVASTRYSLFSFGRCPSNWIERKDENRVGKYCAATVWRLDSITDNRRADRHRDRKIASPLQGFTPSSASITDPWRGPIAKSVSLVAKASGGESQLQRVSLNKQTAASKHWKKFVWSIPTMQQTSTRFRLWRNASCTSATTLL